MSASIPRFLFCFAMSIGMVSAVAQPSKPQVQRAADRLLADLHARGQFDGAVVLVRGDEEYYARGFGWANVAARAPFTPDTPADAGSIAKTFAAASILLLESEGRLKLSDPVQKYIPEYPHAHTSVQHLITHSSGLPESEYDFFNGLIPEQQVRTTELLLATLRTRNVAPEFEPGSQFRYSSMGFDAGALVVERVTGQPWPAFLRERIFAPLKMTESFVRPARLSDWNGVRTMSYRRTAQGLVLHDVFDNEGFYGGSNLYLSARDLSRWGHSFYADAVLGDAVISRTKESVELWDRARDIGGKTGLTLGNWYYRHGEPRYHYPGSLQGFWSSLYRDDQRRLVIVYVSNSNIPQWLRPLLSRALIDIMESGRATTIPDPQYVELNKADLASLTGVFTVSGVGKVTLDQRQERMVLRIDDGVEYRAFLVGEGQLYIPGIDVWIGVPKGQVKPFRTISWLSIFQVSSGQR